MAIGAITGGADKEIISQFNIIGGILGVCFQIKDDIFDYYNLDVGKPTGKDIREGKSTLPLIYALKNAPESKSAEMINILKSKNYSDRNINILLDFAKEYKGIDEAYKKMYLLLDEAEEIISNFNFDNEMKMYMRSFLLYLKNRTY